MFRDTQVMRGKRKVSHATPPSPIADLCDDRQAKDKQLKSPCSNMVLMAEKISRTYTISKNGEISKSRLGWKRYLFSR